MTLRAEIRSLDQHCCKNSVFARSSFICHLLSITKLIYLSKLFDFHEYTSMFKL